MTLDNESNGSERRAGGRAEVENPTVLALDWGKRRIGLAVSDELGIMAHGLPTLWRRNLRVDFDALTEIIRRRRVTTVIVGNPLNLDGSPSRSSRQAVQFARRLAKHAGVSVEMRDERLTSWEARNRLGSQARDRAAVDRMSAMLLLEEFLGEQHD